LLTGSLIALSVGVLGRGPYTDRRLAFCKLERAGDRIDRALVQAKNALHLPSLNRQIRILCQSPKGEGAGGNEELADRPREHGFTETKGSVAAKINRGSFPATFFVAVMKAIGRENVNLGDV
jgi:Domain of unknown function (DUF6471)